MFYPTVVDCGPPPSVVNGRLQNDPAAYTYLTQVTFNCDIGFEATGKTFVLLKHNKVKP